MPTSTTLFERLGGDQAVQRIVKKFFQVMLQDAELRPFFENCSVSALEVHQVKLLRVLFGPEDERPDHDEYLDFLLATHTRLFRDLGLNEVHFDKFMDCFVATLHENAGIPREAIAEAAHILRETRVVFVYGAQVALREKEYTPEQRKLLPVTTARNLLSLDEPSTLPDPASIDIPDWLTTLLEKESECSNVRAWTCHLIDAFGRDGDNVIADTFLDMPYMNHHVYAAALLQLAFSPSGNDDDDDSNGLLLPLLQYPRGPHHRPIPQALWERMIVQFQGTCHYFMMDLTTTQQACAQLRRYKSSFPDRDLRMVGGVFTPHVLRKTHHKFDLSGMPSDKQAKRSSLRSSCSDNDTASTDNNSTPSGSPLRERGLKSSFRTGKRVWKRLLGWTRSK